MKKGTLAALGIFAVLLLIVFATHEDRVSEGITQMSWKPLSAAEIAKIEISGAHRATLTKSADGWKVSDPAQPGVEYATDANLVKAVVDGLTGFKSGDHVTSKAERHAELEVDDAKGVKVVVSGDKGPLTTLYVGKTSQNGGHYVRAASQPDVFASTTQLGWAVRKNTNDFRDHTVLKVDDLTALKVQSSPPDFAQVLDGAAFDGGTGPLPSPKAGELALRGTGDLPSLTLTASDGGWILTEPALKDFRLDPAASARLIQQFSSLVAQDFATDAGALDDARLVGTRANGSTVALSLGAPQNNLVPARVDGNPQVFLISLAAARQLRTQVNDLRDVSLWSFDPEQVTRVSVATGTKKVVAVKEQGSWKFLEPKTVPDGVDAAQIPSVLRQWLQLRATHYDGTQTAVNACKAPATGLVEVTLADKTTRRLRFGGELGASDVCVTGSNDALTYVMPRAMRTAFERGIELFKTPAAPPPSPANMKGLEDLPPEIRAQIEAQLRQRQQR